MSIEWIYDLVGPDDTPHDWNPRRERIRARIADTLGAMPGSPPAPDMTVLETRRRDTYDQQKISFFAEPGDRVIAWLLTPHDISAPRPAVLCLHETAPEDVSAVPARSGQRHLPQKASGAACGCPSTALEEDENDDSYRKSHGPERRVLVDAPPAGHHSVRSPMWGTRAAAADLFRA